MLIDHVTVSLPAKSGVPEDAVINTFTFAAEADMVTADFVAIETKLTAFYNTQPVGAATALAAYISQSVSRSTAPTFKHYSIDGHLSGTPHGSPVRVQPMAILAAATAVPGLPAECAGVLTYRSAFGTDVEFALGARPRARDRGRVYVGPLVNAAVSDDGTTKRTKLDAAFIDVLGKAGATLMAAAGPTWVVWSRKNAAVHQVVDVQVDDAVDTQRRRGPKPTLRNTYTVG